uniref:Uncharacterized protein n=1 Tax=mine drainage metagenome TaxID=410659 RepID=E6PZS6_9ZZZZ
MNDPREHGLDELGQRLQALGGPVGEQRPAPERESYPQGRQYTDGSFSSAPQPSAPYQSASYPEAPYRDGPFRGAPLPPGPAVGGRTPVPGVASERLERFERLEPVQPEAPSGVAPGVTRNAAAPERPGSESSSSAGTTAYQMRETVSAGGVAGTPGPVPAQAQLPASTSGDAAKGGFHRLAQMVRTALPYVQKLLPLLDGNLATTVGALLAPQAAHTQPAPQVTVDMEPVERQMTELQTSHKELRTSHLELRTQVAEQGATLKGVEDQLERVREATDRNTLEQQELVEDLRSVGSRISKFAVLGLVLLALSVGFNLYLLILLQHLLR